MMTKLNVTIEDHPEIYEENVNYAAMIMCLLPLSAMISGLVFNFLRIFERFERKTILLGIYALVGGASGVFFFLRNTFMFGLICVLMGMVVFFIYTVAFMMVNNYRILRKIIFLFLDRKTILSKIFKFAKSKTWHFFSDFGHSDIDMSQNVPRCLQMSHKMSL